MEKKKKKEAKPYRDEDLCKWIQDGKLYARDLLIRQNLKFIRTIAGSFAINPWIGLDRDDLVQVGSMAMVDAAKSYDPDRGAKFETLRCWNCPGGMRKQTGSPSGSFQSKYA